MGRMTRSLKFALVPAAALLLSAYQLPPHKDGLYAYPKVLESRADGDDITLDYDSKRDILNRDKVAGKVVHAKWISRIAPWHRKARKYKGAGGRTHATYVVGKTKSPRVAVVFLHGRNGTHRLGVQDRSFGGNFNRLQNLLVKGRGRYYTPTFSDFGARGTADLAALIARIEREAPNAAIIFACGSTGTNHCWNLIKDPKTRGRIDGMVLLGGYWADGVVGKADFPVVFAHGSKDSYYPVDRVRDFADAMRRGGQDVRFLEFATGGHGTPIRMIDWRQELNWLLSKK